MEMEKGPEKTPTLRPDYGVVLIDDEPIIVRGLQSAIDWDMYGCRILGTARDGRKGLELIREQKPDIVFTDIYMPNMDGLTMIAALKSEFPDMCVAILTGFRDFEYARTALTLGVERFLLKPSKMDELREAILFMTGKLNERRMASGPVSPQEEPELSPPGTFLVKAALKYMEEHYSEHILLSDVADHVYVSQWHLSKLLNRETGRKYSDLLNGFRIQKAKEYLADPALTIADIAEKVGYTDLANFSRVFRRLTGMSANEYRNRKE